MTKSMAWLGCLLWMCSCQPKTLCDEGQRAMHGGCYNLPKPAPDSGADAALSGDAGACEGDRYEGFKAKCESAGDCGCHAPDCATSPLGYCTRFNCDPKSPEDCPSGWTCLMIPPGSSPDPKLTHLCLAP